jgi:hypothetical protein
VKIVSLWRMDARGGATEYKPLWTIATLNEPYASEEARSASVYLAGVGLTAEPTGRFEEPFHLTDVGGITFAIRVRDA